MAIELYRHETSAEMVEKAITDSGLDVHSGNAYERVFAYYDFYKGHFLITSLGMAMNSNTPNGLPDHL